MKKEIIRRPNLFLVGVWRGGTTSLQYYLGQHPEIFSPRQKYFPFKRNPLSCKLIIKAAYGKWKKEKYALDASHYFQFEEIAKRIKKEVPNAKIIISLRDPKKALHSYYQYLLRRGAINQKISFEKWKKGNEHAIREYKYKENALYWKKRFDDVKVIHFEKWIKNPLRACKEIFRFLGVSDIFEPRIEIINDSKSQTKKIQKLSKITKIFPKWIRAFIIENFPKTREIYERILSKK